MQTRLNIIGTALLGVAGYYTYLNYHYVLTGAMYISGIAFIVFAAIKKDKKDKQIEELHTIATKEFKTNLIKTEKPSIKDAAVELPEETINVLKTISELEEWVAQENQVRIPNIDKSDLLNTDCLSIKLKISTQRVKHHLDQLCAARVIHIYPNGELCGITPKGRALLHEKGLLP